VFCLPPGEDNVHGGGDSVRVGDPPGPEVGPASEVIVVGVWIDDFVGTESLRREGGEHFLKFPVLVALRDQLDEKLAVGARPRDETPHAGHHTRLVAFDVDLDQPGTAPVALIDEFLNGHRVDDPERWASFLLSNPGARRVVVVTPQLHGPALRSCGCVDTVHVSERVHRDIAAEGPAGGWRGFHSYHLAAISNDTPRGERVIANMGTDIHKHIAR
jgi:hypothetical protein